MTINRYSDYIVNIINHVFDIIPENSLAMIPDKFNPVLDLSNQLSVKIAKTIPEGSGINVWTMVIFVYYRTMAVINFRKFYVHIASELRSDNSDMNYYPDLKASCFS